MTKSIKKAKQVRVRHNQAYKTEALALADRIGVAQAAKQLDLHESQLYAWRTKIKADQSITAREQALAVENAKLKRQLADQTEELAILKKATVYFAKSLK